MANRPPKLRADIFQSLRSNGSELAFTTKTVISLALLASFKFEKVPSGNAVERLFRKRMNGTVVRVAANESRVPSRMLTLLGLNLQMEISAFVTITGNRNASRSKPFQNRLAL